MICNFSSEINEEWNPEDYGMTAFNCWKQKAKLVIPEPNNQQKYPSKMRVKDLFTKLEAERMLLPTKIYQKNVKIYSLSWSEMTSDTKWDLQEGMWSTASGN